jgi:sugar lactone lactonase YvrE
MLRIEIFSERKESLGEGPLWDGSVDRVIEMPVKKVTSVMFGGPNLDVLYVTSMAKPPLPRFPSDGVLRGSLFAIHGLGIRGVPEPRFGA